MIIAGAGDADVEAQVAKLAIGDPRVVAEIGYAPLARKRELFRAADAVVLPYTSFASQSGVLHDAYGHGLPVVVSDVGALGPTVAEDRSGIAVRPGDHERLGWAIQEVLQSDRARQVRQGVSRRCRAAFARALWCGAAVSLRRSLELMSDPTRSS